MIHRAQVEEICATTKGLGPRIQGRLLELLESGSIRKLESLRNNPRTTAMAELMGIHGVGETIAKKWFQAGVRSVEDVLQHPRIRLTDGQITGIQFFFDRKPKIPRAEVTAIRDYIAGIANQILPGAIVEACGSYRRGPRTILRSLFGLSFSVSSFFHSSIHSVSHSFCASTDPFTHFILWDFLFLNR